jgi:hypothetical protein
MWHECVFDHEHSSRKGLEHQRKKNKQRGECYHIVLIPESCYPNDEIA